MIYGSICSGIEAATLAWGPLGWKAAFFSEIEMFPRAVLKCHWPNVPLHGDFTTIKENDYGAIDVLVGGTPCQSFSIAGKRKGMDDPRGNLALEFLDLARRSGCRWVVWENVPGVFSSFSGSPDDEDIESTGWEGIEDSDFAAFLEAVRECGFGFAYRVLDAQYFGVAQRRKRVFLIGYLGDWRPAAAVLFERSSLRGHPPPSREAGEDVAGTFGGSSQSGGFRTTDLDNQGAFIPEIAFNCKQTEASPGDVAPPLRAMGHDGSHANAGGQVAVAIQERAVSENPDAGPDGIGIRDDGTSFTLEARQTPQAVAFQTRIGRNGRGYAEDVVPALGGADAGATSDMRPCVAFSMMPMNSGKDVVTRETDIAQPCVGTGQRPSNQGGDVVLSKMTVRRLTPRECERLQGIPDDHTRVAYRGKSPSQCPDGPRYKAIGNSMAVPVMRWIGERIQIVEEVLEANP